jgi:RNA polymerase sigma factor (TIGR02999 family)
VHESYLRLLDAGEVAIEHRAHFLGYAARVMRSVVVDYARKRSAQRRGGSEMRVCLDTGVIEAGPRRELGGELEILRVHDALEELRRIDERLARVVEMRYFAGMKEQDIAQALGVTERTVRRDWEKARLILAAVLK